MSVSRDTDSALMENCTIAERQGRGWVPRPDPCQLNLRCSLRCTVGTRVPTRVNYTRPSSTLQVFRRGTRDPTLVN